MFEKMQINTQTHTNIDRQKINANLLQEHCAASRNLNRPLSEQLQTLCNILRYKTFIWTHQ